MCNVHAITNQRGFAGSREYHGRKRQRRQSTQDPDLGLRALLLQIETQNEEESARRQAMEERIIEVMEDSVRSTDQFRTEFISVLKEKF